jgi:hypothetical protein
MADVPAVIDPARVSRLPERARRLVERHVPRAATPEYTRGIRDGLEFALRLLREGRCSTEQADEALEEAAAQTRARLAPLEEEETRAFLAKYKAEHSQPTAEDLAFWNNLDKHPWVPARQLVPELEDAVRREADSDEPGAPEDRQRAAS